MKALIGCLMAAAMILSAKAYPGYTLEQEVYHNGAGMYVGTEHEGIGDSDFGICDIYIFHEGRMEAWVARQDVGRFIKAGQVVYESILN